MIVKSTTQLFVHVPENSRPANQENFTKTTVEEYRLNRQPETLQEFIQSLIGVDDFDQKETVVWLSDNLYCCQPKFRSSLSHDHLMLQLNKTMSGDPHADEATRDFFGLQLHPRRGFTLEDALGEIHFFFQLLDCDDYYDLINWSTDPQNWRSIFDFPLSPEILHFLLTQTKSRRTHSFLIGSFSAEQCRVLASSYCSIWLGPGCDFSDKGAAFVEAFAARREVDGTIDLRIGYSEYIFDKERWITFLDLPQCRLMERLILENNFDHDVCRAMATARVHKLHLQGDTVLADHGDALAAAIVSGHGPKALSLNRKTLGEGDDLDSHWFVFMNKLRGNRHLESLELYVEVGEPCFSDTEICSILNASQEFEQLAYLSMKYIEVTDTFWAALCDTVRLHPSLTTIDIWSVWEADNLDRTQRTTKLFNAINSNPRIKKVGHNSKLYDKTVWRNRIAPLLECRQSRERFNAIRQEANTSIRAALFGEALASVAKKTWLIATLLRANQDIVADRLDQKALRSNILQLGKHTTGLVLGAPEKRKRLSY